MTEYGPTPVVGNVEPLYARHVHGGETVDYTPVAAVSYGDVIVQGSMVGVALRDIVAGAKGALAIEGSFDFAKAASDGGMAVGTLAYWDDSNKVACGTASGNTYIGKVETTAATAAVLVRVQMESMANASGSVGFGVLPTVAKTATGSTQAHALAAPTACLAAGFNLVSGADATKGVVMPTAAAGKVVEIKNADAAVLKVWPYTSDRFNAAAADAYYAVAASASAKFVAYDGEYWYTTPLVSI